MFPDDHEAFALGAMSATVTGLFCGYFGASAAKAATIAALPGMVVVVVGASHACYTGHCSPYATVLVTAGLSMATAMAVTSTAASALVECLVGP